MDDSKRKPRIKPHDEEDEWDWREYQKHKPEPELDDDLADSFEGEDEDAKTQGK